MSATEPERTPSESAPAPESFGRYLRQERELRGMSLEQIADQTRIGAANLRALEQDDLSRLPARVFLRGYIRAYAQAIGLNADEAVLRYDEHCQQSEPAGAPAPGRRSGPWRLVAAVAGVGLAVAVAAYLLFGL